MERAEKRRPRRSESAARTSRCLPIRESKTPLPRLPCARDSSRHARALQSEAFRGDRLDGPGRLPGQLDEAAQRVRETHLLDRPAYLGRPGDAGCAVHSGYADVCLAAAPTTAVSVDRCCAWYCHSGDRLGRRSSALREEEQAIHSSACTGADGTGRAARNWRVTPIPAAVGAHLYVPQNGTDVVGDYRADGSTAPAITVPCCNSDNQELVADRRFLYTALDTREDSWVGRTPLRAPAKPQRLFAVQNQHIRAFTVSGNTIYYISDYGYVGRADGRSSSRPKKLFECQDCLLNARGIIHLGRYLYWVAGGISGQGETSGGIYRFDLHSHRLTEIVSRIHGDTGPLVTDGRFLYRGNHPLGTIGRLKLDGSMVDEHFITTLGSPVGLVIYKGRIYWASANYDGNHQDVIGEASLANPNDRIEPVISLPGEPNSLAVEWAR